MSREIRYGRVNRATAHQIVKTFEHNKPAFTDLFTKWLGVTPNALQLVLDHHRNPSFWARKGASDWVFNGWSNKRNLNQSTNIKQPYNDKAICDVFKSEANILMNTKNRGYVTFGKGWPL